MSWHGGRKGGSWGTVKFLCQCPSLTLFLLLAHHVAVLDLRLIYALSFEILGRKKCINSKGILVCQKKKIPEQNITRNPFPALLLLSPVQPSHFQLEQSFSLSIRSRCRGTAPKPLCVCCGKRWRLVCRCVWLGAGLRAWVCIIVCLPIPPSPSAFPGGCCVCPPLAGCACIALLVAVGNVCASVSLYTLCVYVCVLVHVCFVNLVGVCVKRPGRKIIISGGNSLYERV